MRVTIKLKLAMAFTTIILLSVATAGLGINSLSALNATLEEMVQGPVTRLQAAQELIFDLSQVARAERNMLIYDRKEDRDRYDQELTQLRQGLLARLDKVDAIATAEGKPKWAAFRAAWQRFA